MSEEIIIDGVDVSECGFLDISPVPDLFLCGESENDFGILECKEYSDCYYKQLKKCEQKLEKIKEFITDYPNACKIKGTCIDDRLCSTCFLGGGLEVCDYILDIIEGAEE